MEVTKQREKPKPKDAGDDYKTEYEDYKEVQTINSMIPIWKKRKSEVKKQEYIEFYKTTFHEGVDPALYFDIHAEGTLNYDALIYIPGAAPIDLYSDGYKKGLALYNSNVLIMDKCEELLPNHLNFVKGIVDSQDLSLNISRETLQQDSVLMAIARRIEKRVLSELEKLMKKDRAKYEKIFRNFGRTLKYGIYASYGQKKEDLADLLLFYSAKQKKMVTFKEYLNKPDATPIPSPKDKTGDVTIENDKARFIYYAAGSDYNQMSKLPSVKTLLDKDYDVLFLTQDVDEFTMQSMTTYDEYMFKNVSSGNLGIDSAEEAQKNKEIGDDNKELLQAMKEALAAEVTSVRVSSRLTDAASCIVADGPVSFEMERIATYMPGEENVKASRALELNPKHKVFDVLVKAFKDGDKGKVKLYSHILLDQALIIEGLPVKDPVEYAKNVTELMK